MPIFEFECLDCGVEFEKLVMRTASVSEVACPMCGSRKVEQKLSAFASPGSARGSAALPGACAPSGG